MKLSTWKLLFDVKKLKTNIECLPSFRVPRTIAADVVKKVLRKHSIVIFGLIVHGFIKNYKTLKRLSLVAIKKNNSY